MSGIAQNIPFERMAGWWPSVAKNPLLASAAVLLLLALVLVNSVLAGPLALTLLAVAMLSATIAGWLAPMALAEQRAHAVGPPARDEPDLEPHMVGDSAAISARAGYEAYFNSIRAEVHDPPPASGYWHVHGFSGLPGVEQRVQARALQRCPTRALTASRSVPGFGRSVRVLACPSSARQETSVYVVGLGWPARERGISDSVYVAEAIAQVSAQWQIPRGERWRVQTGVTGWVARWVVAEDPRPAIRPKMLEISGRQPQLAIAGAPQR